MKKYHLEGLAVISLGIILLIVFVLKVGFNIPPTQNTAAVIGSITSSKTPILNRIDKPVPLNKFQVFDKSSLPTVASFSIHETVILQKPNSISTLPVIR